MIALLLALAEFPALLDQYSSRLADTGAAIADALKSLGFGADQVQAIKSGFSPAQITDVVSSFLGNVTGLVGALVVVITTLLLMAMDASYRRMLLRQLEPTRSSMVDALRAYAANVRRYMVTTTVLGLLQGVLNGLALVFLGVPGAFLWGCCRSCAATSRISAT